MNTAPTVPAYLTPDGGAVYVEELPALRGIRFFHVRCFNAEGEGYAFFPSLAEGTLRQTAQMLGWTENASENPGSSAPAKWLGSATDASVWPDEDGWKLTLRMEGGERYVVNIQRIAEGLLNEMVQVQDWLAQP